MIEVKFKELARERYTEMREWCLENLGRNALWPGQLDVPNGPTVWYTQGDYPKEQFGMTAESGRAKFVFRDDRDATMFSLRWSNKND
jgi:hypothetical protein